MPLDDIESKWLYLFTSGAIALPHGPVPADGDVTGLADQLRVARSREWSEEQALRSVLLAKAFAVIDARKEEIRKALDLQVKVKADPDKDSSDEVDENGIKVPPKSRKTQNLRDPKGRQEKAFEADEASTASESPEGLMDATKAYGIVVKESDKLAAEMTRRSSIDAKTGKIVQKSERLFTDDEIMDELYTPLVREIVVPETIIHPKYSATQKMVEGSNDYYLKECKAKGKKVGTGGAALAKAAVALGATVATTVLASLAPVAAGKDALDHSGALTKAMAARAADITTGIAAALTGAIDAVDQIDDFRNSGGDFSVSGYKAVLNGIALAIGRIVAGSTENQALGMVITDALTGAINASAIMPTIVNYFKNGGDPPIGAIISNVGGMIASGLSAASDETSGLNSTSTAKAGAGVSALFETIAKASEAKLAAAFKKGDWKTVFDVLSTAATQAGEGLPLMLKYADQYDAIPDKDPDAQYTAQAALIKSMADSATNIDKAGSAAAGLASEGMAQLADKLGIKMPPTPSAKTLAAIDKKFEARKKELEAESDAETRAELSAIEDMLGKEKLAYQKSLVCLGSTEPSDADFKSIAKLVEQLERDRKIWDGLNALFGAGIGVASGVTASIAAIAAEVAAPLKVAGQFLKYIANLKSAADRLDAWLNWREAQKDAESAVSPYASSIDNFTRNQGTQFTHYSLQAAANAIQALLACGEMSPYGPAFKVAGAAVGMAAAAEDLTYKFYKQVALKRAWADTKEAFDPKNRGNRKMALLVRQVNPTLAKYTLAYGALIEESPIAITAMNRIGIDRETLARAGDGVAELKGYLEKLYPDDGTAIGVMDLAASATKVPDAVLTTKAWALSYMLWTEKNGLATPNPVTIVANLALAEKLLVRERATLKDEEFVQLLAMLATLEGAFRSFDPRTDSSAPLPAAKNVAETYADLAWASGKAVRMDHEAQKAAATP